jgi:hypothetical protein
MSSAQNSDVGGSSPADQTSAEPGPNAKGAAASEREGSAADDLAAGLDLMLRAARKALANIEPNRIEDLGKRAMRSVENLDRKKVSDFGKRAAKNLDPRKIEEVAEEAGKEILSVIERVAERVEDLLGSRGPGSKGSRPPAEQPETASSEAESQPAPRVRVDGGSN